MFNLEFLVWSFCSVGEITLLSNGVLLGFLLFSLSIFNFSKIEHYATSLYLCYTTYKTALI